MDFKGMTKKYEKDALKTLKEVIAINSVYDEKSVTKAMPYGKGVDAAMKFMEKLAKKDGFDVDMCDGHCIEISCGEGEHTIGIFAHLDIVPVTGDWEYPAFGGEIHDDKMYGRGTSDDKGPAIAAYYALKALRDNGGVKGYRVKLVLGGDEERGSSCLAYYFHDLHKPDVSYGFTPDGDFPLIYGEKGIRDFTYEGKLNLDPIIEIKAGVVPNAVIDSAVVSVKNDGLFKAFLAKNKDLKYKVLEDDAKVYKVEFIGKAAHGSLPELGINAGLIMLKALADCYKNKDLEKFVKDYKDPYGKALGLHYETKNMGVTTYNVGIIEYKDGNFRFVVNFRYPENVDSEKIMKDIQKTTTLKIIPDLDAPVLYFDPEKTPFIKALAKVYVDETGDTKNKPMTIGGGTYAKEAKNSVAFGSHFPGKEDNIHSPNEKIDLIDFTTSMPLYADAIYTLGNLK